LTVRAEKDLESFELKREFPVTDLKSFCSNDGIHVIEEQFWDPEFRRRIRINTEIEKKIPGRIDWINNTFTRTGPYLNTLSPIKRLKNESVMIDYNCYVTLGNDLDLSIRHDFLSGIGTLVCAE
jgi:hypothetical protein